MILLLVRQIQRSLGMTVIMVTHERAIAERFADRIVMMADGQLTSVVKV